MKPFTDGPVHPQLRCYTFVCVNWDESNTVGKYVPEHTPNADAYYAAFDMHTNDNLVILFNHEGYINVAMEYTTNGTVFKPKDSISRGFQLSKLDHEMLRNGDKSPLEEF